MAMDAHIDILGGDFDNKEDAREYLEEIRLAIEYRGKFAKNNLPHYLPRIQTIKEKIVEIEEKLD